MAQAMKREIYGPSPWFFGWGPSYRDADWTADERAYCDKFYPFEAQHAIEWFNDRLAGGSYAKWLSEREAA